VLPPRLQQPPRSGAIHFSSVSTKPPMGMLTADTSPTFQGHGCYTATPEGTCWLECRHSTQLSRSLRVSSPRGCTSTQYAGKVNAGPSKRASDKTASVLLCPAVAVAGKLLGFYHTHLEAVVNREPDRSFRDPVIFDTNTRPVSHLQGNVANHRNRAALVREDCHVMS
jgi:hypothetical protein